MRGNYKTIKKLVCGKVREFVLMPTYNGEIRELWQEIAEDKDAFYVYSYGKLIEGEFKHRYVGIGTWERYKQAKRHNTPLTGNIKNNEYYKIIICNCDTRERAARIEEVLINFFGRKDLGTGGLYNLTNGGEYGAKGAVRSIKTRAKMSEWQRGKNNNQYKDKSHITEDVLWEYFQTFPRFYKDSKIVFGIAHSAFHRMLKERYGTGVASDIYSLLADKLGKIKLNHANFIKYCKKHRGEFLQKSNDYFGISGEKLQRWCLRTYSKAKTQTIDGWEKRAKELERGRIYKAQKRASQKSK